MSLNAKSDQETGQLCPLLTVKQLAELLGIHERTVWRLASLAQAGQSDFPRPLRIAAKTVRWRQKELEAYLAALAGDGNQ